MRSASRQDLLEVNKKRNRRSSIEELVICFDNSGCELGLGGVLFGSFFFKDYLKIFPREKTKVQLLLPFLFAAFFS